MTQTNEEIKIKFDPKDPAILDMLAKSYQKRIVGEFDTIKFLISCYISKDLPRKYRLHTIIASQSSAGKSSIIRTVAEPFAEHLIDYTNFTPAFLKRQEGFMDGKILLLEQLEKTNENNQASMFDLKFLLSEGKIRVGITEKDDKGKFKPKTLEVLGIPVFITTSTRMNIDPETLNRTFLIQADESEEQTERIIEYQLESYSSLLVNNDWKEELAHLTAFFEKYRQLAHQIKDIALPFGDKLKGKIPVENLTIRRDLPKILSLTAVIAFIHSSNRHRIQYNEGENFITSSFGDTEKRFMYTILAEPDDFKEALQIAGVAIKQTLNKVNETSMKLYARIIELYDSKTYATSTLDGDGKVLGVTVKDVAEKTRKSENRTRELMAQLEHADYLIRDRSEKVHRFVPTGKKFTEITIDDLTFSKVELDEWILKQTARHGQKITVIPPPSCNNLENENDTK